MDYNDNDYEGHNLHLAGEESSKISVLRPFALPKFDFDDNLNGHLRFDSLVENEVFLGISSQEDSHWIEDFSRGGNGIEFRSSAAESCALPRHINVWSEATSSESVEMLLKAVGQEEMVSGENMIEESDPGNQRGSSTRIVDSNMRDARKIDDVDDGIPSLSPADVVGISFTSCQTSAVESQRAKCTLQVQETKLSFFGGGIDNKDSSLTVASEDSNFVMKRVDNNQGEICGLVGDSLSHQMQKELPFHGKEIDNSKSFSKNSDVNARQSVDQDKISSTIFSSSCIVKCTSNLVQEQDSGCIEADASLAGISLATDDLEKHTSQETTSIMLSQKEEHAVDNCTSNTVEVSSIQVTEESVSKDDGCNNVAFIVEPGDCSQCCAASGPEIKQLSESNSTLLERSSIVPEELGIEGLDIGGSDSVPSALDCSDEMLRDPLIQSPERHKALEAQCAASVPTILHEELGDSPVKVHGPKTGDASDDSGKSICSTVSGECSEKSVADAKEDARYTPAAQNVEDGEFVHLPSVDESLSTCKKDIVSMQVDAHESVNFSAHEKEVEIMSLGSNEMVFDDADKVGMPTCSERVEVQKTAGSNPNNSVGNYPANNEAEDTILATSYAKGDQFIDSHEHNEPSSEKDQIRQTESEAPDQPCTSAPKESLDESELSPVSEIDKDAIPASLAGEIKTSHQSVSVLETSSVNVLDEAPKDISEMIEHPGNAVVAENDGIEAALSKEQMVAETKRNIAANSSKLTVTSGIVEIDKSDKVAAPGASSTDLSQSEVNNQASLKKPNNENFGKIFETSQTSGVNELCKEDETFTFDTTPLGGQSTEDAGRGLKSFPVLQACEMLTGEGFPAVSISCQTDPITETSHVGSSTPGFSPSSGGVGAPSERKSRRGGNRSGKGSSKKGNIAKEKTPQKQTEKGDKLSSFFSPLGPGQLMTFESGVKPRGPVSIPTSSLPDLNTSAPSSSFFQQPFTDLQQVQLRAQIFVYGSLIQGAAPDEACMVSAFGMSDGGRSVWERSWRACAERLHSQKSQGNNTRTPVPSRSDAGAKAPDQTNRQGFPQGDVLSSTGGRTSMKAITSPVNPAIPLSSPLWNISTPSAEVLPPGSMARSAVIDYQAVNPLNPYQTPPIRNYIAHSTWPTQAPPAPFPVPWLASSQSSPFEISTNYPAFPIAEPVKLTGVKEPPLSITSGMKNTPPTPTISTGATAVSAGASLLDLKNLKASSGQTSDTKSRKRKKSSGSEDVVQIAAAAPLSDTISAYAVPSQLYNKVSAAEDFSQTPFIAHNQVGLVTTPVVGSYYSTSVAVSTPSSFAPKGPSDQVFPVVTPSIISGHVSKADVYMDSTTLKAEGFSRVEEAKLQAHEAAVHAAAAISHCEGVWSQLDLQKSSGLASDAESKLASAAAAMAAAAAVAKAAAAAAKIAADAAEQAKLMADEALTNSGTSMTNEYDSNFSYNFMNLVNASPSSILRGGERNNAPSLVISAAREAARKRIEAASAATKHAENLDAILKAAELAAEAVVHAGKVVAMGDPFSLSALAEAGPSNYWKVPQVADIPGSKLNDTNNNKSISNNATSVPTVYNQCEGLVDVRVTSHNMSPSQRELSKDTGDSGTIKENFISPDKHGEHGSEPHNGRKVSDSAKTTCHVYDTDFESRSNILTTSMREGSPVEVLKDHGESSKAWFPASVLSLKDGEALVCYDGQRSDEGSEQLKEWISIEAKDGDAPRIRVPHPMTIMQLEGTRKRRRAAVKNYTWSVGDRVDAWVQDCWREGTIAEKNKRDATLLSVHFPAQGESVAVKVWHVRPSLVWSDGEWTECYRPGQDGTCQGDTPVEKRPKLGSTGVEAKGKAKIAKNIDFAEVGVNEGPKLPLSANEKVFNVGSTREESKLNVARTMRSGLEKEGPRVVFGVPKPGKKRKFMEVSKHYVSDRISKKNVPNDSAKLSKFLMPQGSGSRVLKNSSKLDSKEKQVADPKPRPLRSGKPPSIPSRTLARRDDSTSSRSNARENTSSDHLAKGSSSNDDNESSVQNLAEVEQASQVAMEFSSQALPQGNLKKAVRNIRSERLNRGKLAPASRKSPKDEERLISKVAEPRRSNRRIQPTSRLLEGLQSSLVISKLPSTSHDKGHKSHNKGTNRGINNRG